MAKEEIVEHDDDFIMFDDEEEAEETEAPQAPSDAPLEEEASNNKLLYTLIAVFTLIAFVLLGFLTYLYLEKQEAKKEAAKTENIIKNVQEKKSPPTKAPSYEALLKEAQMLFDAGKKEKALLLFDDLSRYNKALSYYNIGVNALKRKAYDKAIQSFKLALSHPKLTFEAQLNIAIAALANEDKARFKEYLDLATLSLDSRVNSPLYAYYHSLIDYYRGFYAEALIPLRHQTSPFYEKKKNHLLAKLYTAFHNETEAIKALEKNALQKDAFTLGLLYANQEAYTLAEKYLLKAVEAEKKPLKKSLALAHVYMQMGLYKKASKQINNTYKIYKDKTSNTYPIKAKLKEALFDPIVAQKEFQKNIFYHDRNKFSLIFYFAPYQLINPKQSINNINKGAKNIYVNALEPAFNNLKLSGKIADANIEITRGIQATLKGNLYDAIDIFNEGLKKYPSSAALHYNIALTYAKLYNFQQAYAHFRRSSVLDVNHSFTPIFTYFCAKLLFKEQDKNFFIELEEKIQNGAHKEEKAAALTLLAIARQDIQLADTSLGKTPFEDVLMLIVAQMRQEFTLYQSSAQALLQKLPNDIIANILHVDAFHDKQNIKAYAKNIQERLTKSTLNYTPLYSGHALVKELYVQMLHMAGLVPNLKQRLEYKLREKGKNDIALLQALGYADIFLQDFEQAYNIYNYLIDDKKQQDSNTLFLASIASIGAKHHENAIALLELSKLTNKANLESRYALGILYHEVKNLEGASIQYAKIGDGGFHSRYFAYDLDKR